MVASGRLATHNWSRQNPLPTFTDWLDDIHDTYMTEAQFEAADPLAQEMSNRVNYEYVDDAIEKPLNRRISKVETIRRSG